MNRHDAARRELHKEQGNFAFPLSGKGSDPDRSHTSVEIPPGTSYFNYNAQGSDCACIAHSALLKQHYPRLGGFVVVLFGLVFFLSRESCLLPSLSGRAGPTL